LTDFAQDALQRLKIIPKDIYPTTIDLTDSPPPSPRVKQEPRLDGVKQEDGKHAATDTKVKREPGGDDWNAQTSVTRGLRTCSKHVPPTIETNSERLLLSPTRPTHTSRSIVLVSDMKSKHQNPYPKRPQEHNTPSP